MRRVVITGMGAICSAGMNKDVLWRNVKSGSHGFYPISKFNTDGFEVKYAAEIQEYDPLAGGIPKKEARRMDLFCQYALIAAAEAVRDAGDFASDLDPYRVGVIAASGIGGIGTIEEEYIKFLEKGAGRVSVFLIPMMISNMAGGKIAMEYGFKGENFCPVSACASSNHAVGEAFRKIKYGSLDAAIAGGSESAISLFCMAGFNNMGALARGSDPNRISIPFDAERGGFVMGEGGGMMVLEELEHAKRRGAHIYGEIAGYGATNDAYHITSPDPSGEGPAKAMIFAMEEAGISGGDIDYINAHGTSTELNDKYETAAIKLALGEKNARKAAISSTKSVTGHLLGAAGAVEGMITSLALEEGILPPTSGYRIPDPDCDLDYVTEGARKSDLRYALSNSLGFGGHNASIAFRRYDG